jgi:hypothetical protein
MIPRGGLRVAGRETRRPAHSFLSCRPFMPGGADETDGRAAGMHRGRRGGDLRAEMSCRSPDPPNHSCSRARAKRERRKKASISMRTARRKKPSSAAHAGSLVQGKASPWMAVEPGHDEGDGWGPAPRELGFFLCALRVEGFSSLRQKRRRRPAKAASGAAGVRVRGSLRPSAGIRVGSKKAPKVS